MRRWPGAPPTAGYRCGSSIPVLLGDVALVASVAGIVTLTLNPQSEVAGNTGIQLVPFGDIFNALTSLEDPSLLVASVANLLLFMPFGAALYLRELSLSATVLTGFVMTAAVEGAQLLLISGRTTSVDDLVLNTAGAALGHALLLRWLTSRYRNHEDIA
ncbi:MAG: VanZ family protein [Actinomycetota bacterium]|nr:VanZ family protein [Actinomycetota bacterium]